MVSNRSRAQNSVGNKLNDLDTRVSRSENSSASNISTNSVTNNQIATNAVTSDSISGASVQNTAVARGAIGGEHLGIVNEINSDSSLTLNVGGPTDYLQIQGDQYSPPASGSVPLALNSNRQVTMGLDSSVTDSIVSALINNTSSSSRTAINALIAALGVSSGDVKMVAGTTAPSGWLLCNGTAVSRTTYASLYAAIGTYYGAGDGSTTFNLPNLQGRVPVGVLSSNAAFDTPGDTGGEYTHTMTQAELVSHTHTQNAHSHGVTDNGHNHSQNSHSHGVNDPGHNHGQDAHSHSQVGHSHGPNTLNGFTVYTSGAVTRSAVSTTITNNKQLYAFTADTQAYLGFAGSTDSQAPGIYSTTATNQASGTGISLQSTTASNNASTTGISVNSATPTNNNTGSTTPFNVVQPYVAMNYAIKI